MDRLRPPLEPRVAEELEPLDAAALEDEERCEAADLANLHAPKAALRRVAISRARLTGADLGEASLRDASGSARPRPECRPRPPGKPLPC